ncbi:MAG TPA: SurA N-terminal domain-containing protein [Pyrinomonadaceae bacterium]|nr:SurA N-terminal domain-containing protein [Pyrinomonadaceae bacterium]
MQKTTKLLTLIMVTMLAALGFSACSKDGGSDPSAPNTVAATVDGRPIMSAEVERQISLQAGGKQAQLSQLQIAQARLQVLDRLIQREVLFQRAEREKLLPTEDQINSAINSQKQNSGMTDEDFAKNLKEQGVTMDVLKEEARKDLAISSLQDKYAGKITINDREVEEYYNNNRSQFVNTRGVALAMVMVDPADNSGQGITNSDAKNETEAKLKIDGIYQQLKGGADFATVARAKSEDANTLAKGGDIGFATEDDLKQNGFPQDLVSRLFGMEVGSFTDPVHFNSGRWYIFKLEEKRLQTENLTLESPGVRQQITQALVNSRKDILNAALLEVALSEAKVVNNMAASMLSNPGNLGLRPAAPGTAGTATPAASPAASTAAASPAATAAASPKTAASPVASPKK